MTNPAQSRRGASRVPLSTWLASGGAESRTTSPGIPRRRARPAGARSRIRLSDLVGRDGEPLEWGVERQVDSRTIHAVIEAVSSSRPDTMLGGSAFNAIHAIAKTKAGLRLGYVGVAGRVPLSACQPYSNSRASGSTPGTSVRTRTTCAGSASRTPRTGTGPCSRTQVRERRDGRLYRAGFRCRSPPIWRVPGSST